MGAESHQDLLRALGAALALLAVALLAACGAGSGPQPAEDSGALGGTGTRTASGAPDIFFPQVRKGLDGGPTAGMGERLILDDEGCLKVWPGQDGPKWVPVWPANLRLETGDVGVRIVDKEGRTVAEVGKKVSMGGGQIGLPKDAVSPRTARELRDRCSENPGDYWIAISPSLGPPATPVGSITPDG